jgi:integrase
MTSSYWFAPRPENTDHQHLYLVFDTRDRLHLPLTVYGKEASYRLSPKTVQTYLYALMPFFTWLETDEWQLRAGVTWDAAPVQLRRAVEDYLVSKLQCKVQQHHHGWKFVTITTGARNTIRVFLASLKLFYRIMGLRGSYSHQNPLSEPVSATVAAIETRLEQEDGAPRMPDQSGVASPRQRPKHRLSDNYFKLERDEWVPQILDDPQLPALILGGGKHLSLKYTRLRDEVVTWLLFETGARVSEVVELMLSDWAALGTNTKVKTFNKGSFGRRTKTLSFADDTVILLKRYFDEERICFDPQGYDLDTYLDLAARKQIDLSTIPLFLTTQGTQLTPKEYREHYWNLACQAAHIEADVHQSRHWHVTQEVRYIYETSKDQAEVERRLQGLVKYMKWQSEETLAVYQHYFDQKRDDDTRDQFHKGMHQQVQRYLEERTSGKRRRPVPRKKEQTLSTPLEQVQSVDEPDLAFLYALAREA